MIEVKELVEENLADSRRLEPLADGARDGSVLRMEGPCEGLGAGHRGTGGERKVCMNPSRQSSVIRDDDSIPAPSFDELIELSRVDGIPLRDIKVIDGDETVARALCAASVRRHHGVHVNVFSLFGGALHDYLPFFAKSHNAARQLLRRIVDAAQEAGCDVILLGSIPEEYCPQGMFRTLCERRIFDSEKAANGWRCLYDRKSVRRFWKELNKKGEISISAREGEITPFELDELASLHKWRWRFSGATSAFADNPRRKQEYAVHPSNKIYLTIRLNGEIVACHYGMHYQQTVLWHTPLINPKYLKFSPLRLLLATTAQWCEAHDVKRLDFGLGDEEYKMEYCQEDRKTVSFSRALTFKGLIAECLGFVVAIGGKTLYMRGHCLARTMRARLFEAFRRREYFVSGEISTPIQDGMFVRLKSWESFCDFMRTHNACISQWQYDRFRSDKTLSFVCLADDACVYCYGWETFSNRSLLKRKDLPNFRILYDFVTPVEHRRCGWCTRLLKSLGAEFPSLIYASPRNVVSCRAIQNAGFKRIERKS